MRKMLKANVGLVLAFVFCLGLISTAGAKEVYKEADSKAVEDFVHKNKGKIVVVNVFATWCAPCVTEVPDFVKAHTTYPEDKLAMLGVNANVVKGSANGQTVYRVQTGTLSRAQAEKMAAHLRQNQIDSLMRTAP